MSDGRVEQVRLDVRSPDEEILDRLEYHHQILTPGRFPGIGTFGPVVRQESNRHFVRLIRFESGAALVIQSDAVTPQDDIRSADGRAGSSEEDAVLDVATVRQELVAAMRWRQIEIGHFASRVEITTVGLDSVVDDRRTEVGSVVVSRDAGVARREETSAAVGAQRDELEVVGR